QLLSTSERQHPMGHRRSALCCLQRVLQERTGRGVTYPLEHEMHRPLDDHQKIVEVMGHAPCQLAQRLHLLRLKQRLSRLLQGHLRLAAFRDVTSDLGKADERSIDIPNRIDDHARPDQLAVLANPPCLCLETPLSQGRSKATLRLPLFPISLREEQGIVFSNHLFRGVTLYALGAAVPV